MSNAGVTDSERGKAWLANDVAHEAAAWAEHALRGVLPANCGVAAMAMSPNLPALPPVEAAAVVKAVASRRNEFALGRAAARAAMQSIGLPAAPIPMGVDRAPEWPTGVIGSISHQAGVAIAAAARTNQVRAIGIDVEQSGAVGEELWAGVLTESEVAFVRGCAAGEREKVATVFFGLKEAFFKFQYPLTHYWLDFRDVSVRLDLATQTARVRTSRPLSESAGARDEFGAWFAIGRSLTLAALWWEGGEC